MKIAIQRCGVRPTEYLMQDMNWAPELETAWLFENEYHATKVAMSVVNNNRVTLVVV